MVNFLHHAKGYSIDKAESLYVENLEHIDKVFNLVGEDVMINILKEVKGDNS
jgi:hypothetical protein